MARGEEEEFVDDDENEDSDFAADGDGDDSEEEEEQGSEEEEASAASTKSKKRGRKPAAADDKAKKKKKKGAQFFEEEADEVGGCRAWAAQASHPARSLPPAVVLCCCRTCSNAHAIIIDHTCSTDDFVAYTLPSTAHSSSEPWQQLQRVFRRSEADTTTAVCACSCSKPSTSSCMSLAHVASGSTSCVSSSPTHLLHTITQMQQGVRVHC